MKTLVLYYIFPRLEYKIEFPLTDFKTFQMALQYPKISLFSTIENKIRLLQRFHVKDYEAVRSGEVA